MRAEKWRLANQIVRDVFHSDRELTAHFFHSAEIVADASR
jgi:hypothetical protein